MNVFSNCDSGLSSIPLFNEIQNNALNGSFSYVISPDYSLPVVCNALNNIRCNNSYNRSRDFDRLEKYERYFPNIIPKNWSSDKYFSFLKDLGDTGHIFAEGSRAENRRLARNFMILYDLCCATYYDLSGRTGPPRERRVDDKVKNSKLRELISILPPKCYEFESNSGKPLFSYYFELPYSHKQVSVVTDCKFDKIIDDDSFRLKRTLREKLKEDTPELFRYSSSLCEQCGISDIVKEMPYIKDAVKIMVDRIYRDMEAGNKNLVLDPSYCDKLVYYVKRSTQCRPDAYLDRLGFRPDLAGCDYKYDMFNSSVDSALKSVCDKVVGAIKEIDKAGDFDDHPPFYVNIESLDRPVFSNGGRNGDVFEILKDEVNLCIQDAIKNPHFREYIGSFL